MTTTITGNETETPDTNTDTLSGGLTNGQIVRALFGNGLELNSAGEIVVKNAEQVGGKTPSDLLGQFSFSGEAMRGNGGGNVLTARTDASGDRTAVNINPSGAYPDGTRLDGRVSIAGTFIGDEKGGPALCEVPIIWDAVNPKAGKAAMYQWRSKNKTPLFTIENGAGARTSTYNGTFSVGFDERDDSTSGDGDPTGNKVQLGATSMAVQVVSGGELAAVDKNGNFTTIS